MDKFGYVIYDKVSCELLTFSKSKEVIIYGDHQEALEDCAKGQIVLKLTKCLTE